MDFVDEQDGARCGFHFGDDGFQPLLEIAAIAGAGEQRAHVERENRRFEEDFRDVAVDDALGQALGDRGFADARVAHIKRVVLGAAAKNLDRALDLMLSADQRVDLAALRLFVEVDAVGGQSVLAFTGGFFLPLAFRRVGRAGGRARR